MCSFPVGFYNRLVLIYANISTWTKAVKIKRKLLCIILTVNICKFKQNANKTYPSLNLFHSYLWTDLRTLNIKITCLPSLSTYQRKLENNLLLKVRNYKTYFNAYLRYPEVTEKMLLLIRVCIVKILNYTAFPRNRHKHKGFWKDLKKNEICHFLRSSIRVSTFP